MGLKESFQRAIHVWWSYWFSPPSSLDVSFYLSTFSSLCWSVLPVVNAPAQLSLAYYNSSHSDGQSGFTNMASLLKPCQESGSQWNTMCHLDIKRCFSLQMEAHWYQRHRVFTWKNVATHNRFLSQQFIHSFYKGNTISVSLEDNIKCAKQ